MKRCIAHLALYVCSIASMPHATGIEDRVMPTSCRDLTELFEIGGADQSPYLVSPAFADTIALTFDDGPDELGMTTSVLDTLQAYDVKATFFVNTQTHSPLRQSPVAQEALRRMERDGHRIGNHTAHHPELVSLSSDQVAQELVDVEQQVQELLGRATPQLTLMRAPYGRPFNPSYRLGEDPEGFCRVASVVAPKAVHVYWDLDPRDWEAETADEVVARVESLITAQPDANRARRGILLLHSDRPQTAAALPQILTMLKHHRIAVVDLEAYVRETHGEASSALLSGRLP